MSIAELGHTGVWVYDLAKMRDFYENVMELEVTDEDPDIGIVFFSSRPEVEHHEFVIQRGRDAEIGSYSTHQISWRVDSIDDVIKYHKRFKELGVQVQQEVTHGNAFGIYFYDPEGNRNEVYLRVEKEVKQPFRKSLNLDQPASAIFKEAETLLANKSADYQPIMTPFDPTI